MCLRSVLGQGAVQGKLLEKKYVRKKNDELDGETPNDAGQPHCYSSLQFAEP